MAAMAALTIFIVSPSSIYLLGGGAFGRAPKGDGGQSSMLTHPLDGGLISRAPKGDGGQSSLLSHPYGRAPKGPYQSST